MDRGLYFFLTPLWALQWACNPAGCCTFTGFSKTTGQGLAETLLDVWGSTLHAVLKYHGFSWGQTEAAQSSGHVDLRPDGLRQLTPWLGSLGTLLQTCN